VNVVEFDKKLLGSPDDEIIDSGFPKMELARPIQYGVEFSHAQRLHSPGAQALKSLDQ
jgi:hypothetical protein